MILTLLAVSLNDQALSRPITARFDTAGGTIGRADHSTMALPDPERFISRKQAEIVFAGHSFMIRNVGAANPITVAQRSLAAGETAPLRHGDEVRIGGYLLRAELRTDEGARPVGDIAATVVSSASGPMAAGPGATAPPASPGPPRSPRAPQAPAAAPRPPATPPAFADLAPPLAGDNPFADLLGPPASAPAGAVGPPATIDDDPFAGLMPAPAGLDPALGGVGSTTAPAAARLPDDFDPFAPGASSAPSSPSAPSPRSTPPSREMPTFSGLAAPPADSDPDDRKGQDAADPFADLLGAGSGGPIGAPSIDQAFGLGSSDAGDDALARFVSGPAPAAPAAGSGGSVPTDPLLLFGEDGAAARAPNAGSAPAASPPAAGGPAALPDHVPAVHGAFVPPRPATPPARPPAAPAFIPATVVAQPPAARPRAEAPAPPPAATARPAAPAPARRPAPAHAPAPGPMPAAATPAARPAHATAASTAASTADTAALWRALCEGAGIDLPAPAGEGEALMRHIGRILRAAVEGTLQLIAVRASTKHEMRVKVTQIQASGNNPLKFSPDATSGLEQLLSPPQRGFMDGATAMDDAMLDLVGHSIGTVAGMRAAIENMLDRYDPEALENKLGAGSRLANLLPPSRRARLWELYLQHHRHIRDEAEEDFHAAFGRAFVAAYEQQVDQLEKQQRERQRAARR